MKSQKILIGLVVVLAVALILETAYLLGMHRLAGVPNTHFKQSLRPAATSLRLWGDRSFFSDDQNTAMEAWEPFREMERIQHQMNRLFRDSFEKAVREGSANFPESKNFFEPEVDVRQTDAAYIVQMDIPGLNKEQISIKIRDNALTVSGERKREVSEQGKGGVVKEEREFGYFSRSIPLPQDARQGDIKAGYDKGVLVVTIPKAAGNNEQAKQPVDVKID